MLNMHTKRVSNSSIALTPSQKYPFRTRDQLTSNLFAISCYRAAFFLIVDKVSCPSETFISSSDKIHANNMGRDQ